ncbi:MAG TPA: T6SS immunity protein Tli4 family protein, partial [Telluria sp.]
MKRFLRRISVKVVVLVVSAFGAVLWTVDAVWSMQEPGKVASMSKQMKTVCVGRFLIDVPASAQVSIGSAAVDGFDIVNYGKETREQFDGRMAQREAEINAGKNRAGLKNMESVQAIRQDVVNGKIFVFDRKTSYYFAYGEKIPTESISVNGYAHVNNMSFGFIANGYKPELASGLSVLLAQLQPMGKDTVPTQPGFCLDGAFLRDRASGEPDESIVMFAGLPGHEDLGIALATIAGTTPGPGLIERNAANRAGPYAFLNAFLSTLLEGKRSINGMEGDELAFRARERNF